MFAVLEMEPQINGHLLKMSLFNMRNCDFFYKKQNIPLNREFYKLSNDIYAAIIKKVLLSEF